MACNLLNVILTSPYEINLVWELPSPKESGDHTFTVERSGSPEGEWQVLEEDDEIYSYLDDSAPAIALDLDIYYRIKVTPPSGAGCIFYSEVKKLEKILTSEKIEGEFKKFNDRFNYLANFTLGLMYDEIKIYKKRRWGQKCTLCWDDVLEQAKIGECDVCFGTGFQKGYWLPISKYAKIEPYDKKESDTMTDVSDQVDVAVSLAGDTTINKGDLIIEVKQLRVLQVQKVNFQEVSHLPLMQTIYCNNISQQSIEYRIPDLFSSIVVTNE